MSEQQLPANAAPAVTDGAGAPAPGGAAAPAQPGALQFLQSLPLPSGRSLALIVALAVGLAALFVAMLWLDTSTYRALYADLGAKDEAEIVAVLEAAGVPVRLNPQNGNVEVPADQVHEARLKLAGEGLPKGDGGGLDAIIEGSRIGTSGLMDAVRIRSALEKELARSVASLDAIDNARVHLAMERQSPFAREKSPPTASVIVKLFAGRSLSDGQVTAITYLVSTAIAGMTAENVSIVDHSGRLLSANGSGKDKVGLDYLDYQRNMESGLVRRIEQILAPMVGAGHVRAEVSAQLDFTEIERTEKKYDENERPQVRSERVSRLRGVDNEAQGVPGALVNEPAVTPGEGGAGAGGIPGGDDPTLRRSEWTRNYELDESISRVKVQGGRLERLSVAVIVDHASVTAADGTVTRQPWSDEQLAKFTESVKHAVGFDVDRGDSVHVTNSEFYSDPMLEEPWWQQAWFLSVAKLGAIFLLALLLLLMVVRPLMKALTRPPEDAQAQGAKGGRPHLTVSDGDAEQLPDNSEQERSSPYALGSESDPFPEMDAPLDYQSDIRLAQRVAASDPRRAAQVIRRWLEHAS